MARTKVSTIPAPSTEQFTALLTELHVPLAATESMRRWLPSLLFHWAHEWCNQRDVQDGLAPSPVPPFPLAPSPYAAAGKRSIRPSPAPIYISTIAPYAGPGGSSREGARRRPAAFQPGEVMPSDGQQPGPIPSHVDVGRKRGTGSAASGTRPALPATVPAVNLPKPRPPLPTPAKITLPAIRIHPPTLLNHSAGSGRVEQTASLHPPANPHMWGMQVSTERNPSCPSSDDPVLHRPRKAKWPRHSQSTGSADLSTSSTPAPSPPAPAPRTCQRASTRLADYAIWDAKHPCASSTIAPFEESQRAKASAGLPLNERSNSTRLLSGAPSTSAGEVSATKKALGPAGSWEMPFQLPKSSYG